MSEFRHDGRRGGVLHCAKHQEAAQMTDVVSEITMVPVEAIRPYPHNPRVNDKTVDALCAVLPVVGFNQPLLLDRQNTIVKGHARLKAAIRLGLAEVPCVYSTADPESIKLDRIADNRVTEFSLWDTVLLPGEIAACNGFPEVFESLDFLIPAPLMPPVSPRADDRPFITPEDERATVPRQERHYESVECPKCGNTTYYIPR
jgi:hypothetical protein